MSKTPIDPAWDAFLPLVDAPYPTAKRINLRSARHLRRRGSRANKRRSSSRPCRSMLQAVIHRCVLVLTIASCGQGSTTSPPTGTAPPASPPAPSDAAIAIGVAVKLAQAIPTVLVIDGKPYPLPACSTSRGLPTLGKAPSRVVLQFPLPCGLREIELAPSAWWELAIPGKHAWYELDEMWVDNRGGPATTLAIGKFESPIPAGYSGHVWVPTPDCSEGTEVKLGATSIGKLPVSKVDPDHVDRTCPGSAQTHEEQMAAALSGTLHIESQPASYLVASSPKHCYAGRTVTYGAGIGFRNATKLTGKQLYELPAGVLYLEHAPESVTAGSRFEFMASRFELLDCKP